jgi:SPP1 gp7 family putative phage head morphogenesis protein
MTEQDLKRITFLTRQAAFQARLDQYTDDQLNMIMKAIDKTKINVNKKLARKIDINSDDKIGMDRLDNLLTYLNTLTVGVKEQLGGQIDEIIQTVSAKSILENEKILSFDDKINIDKNIKLSAAQLQEAVTAPVGGMLLNDWVDRVFTYPLQDQIKTEFLTGMLEGAGYRQIVKRVLDGFEMSKREAITLARTTVQSVNTAAQMAVYKANDDIIKGVRWTATLEPGYKKTGRGTCLRCAALDGTEYKLNEKKPDMPKHPRCRCIYIPITKSYRELGLDMDEMEEASRRYTLRERDDKRIDAGGNRGKIIESEIHDGDYSSWFNTRDDQFKLNVLGPKRFELLKSGKVEFKDFVDSKTGDVFTMDELK